MTQGRTEVVMIMIKYDKNNDNAKNNDKNNVNADKILSYFGAT